MEMDEVKKQIEAANAAVLAVIDELQTNPGLQVNSISLTESNLAGDKVSKVIGVEISTEIKT